MDGQNQDPVVAAPDVKPGEQTTEHAAMQSGSAWGIVTIVLGALTTVATAAGSLGQDTKVGIIAGAVLAMVGAATTCLVKLGYIKARADVKVAASQGQALADMGK